jgi:hypothetical protein
MGCDIHGFFEIKDKNGKWKVLKEIAGDRDYWWFSVIANVRNDGDIVPISGPRGEPDDPTPEIEHMYEEWGADLHSESYLDHKEITSAWKKYIKHLEKVQSGSDNRKLFDLCKKVNKGKTPTWMERAIEISKIYEYDNKIPEFETLTSAGIIIDDNLKIIGIQKPGQPLEQCEIRMVFAFDN